jgi:hypothetical protein
VRVALPPLLGTNVAIRFCSCKSCCANAQLDKAGAAWQFSEDTDDQPVQLLRWAPGIV